jgi:hypothetical protein
VPNCGFLDTVGCRARHTNCTRPGRATSRLEYQASALRVGSLSHRGSRHGLFRKPGAIPLSPRLKRAIRSGAVVFLLLAPPEAFGAERASTTFSVAPSAFERCATGEDFATELVRRNKRARLGRADDAALVFRVELLEEPGATSGRLTVRERDGQVTVRVVPGADCREVITALAVIAAVLVDPDPPSGDATVSRTETVESRDSVKTARPTRPGWGFGAGAGLLLQTGVAPHARPGAGVEAHVASRARRLLSPLFALGGYYTLAETVPTPGGSAELNWWAVRSSACPFRWPEDSSIILRPCALFDAGRLAGSGSGTAGDQSRSGTWIALGASGRIEAAPVPGLWIAVEGGALAPLVRHRFYFAPDTPPNTAFETPDIAPFGRFSIAGRWE